MKTHNSFLTTHLSLRKKYLINIATKQNPNTIPAIANSFARRMAFTFCGTNIVQSPKSSADT